MKKKKANSKTKNNHLFTGKNNEQLFTKKTKEKIGEKLNKIKQEYKDYIKEYGRTWLN
ncbi:hypothetical protein [Microcystis aeruginosa]|uniref:Uncharacterized protein n=1 Tax=Microcystis aeruginosa PCC 9443 TaxID=1160281 RepID=I4G5T8_MICAE|nr:hypothetical protein [Microcystis aeruginosa]CCI03299.1 hypothetical protein MICAC_4400004 [Microcystis aeruginosa PCC 9443]